MAEYPVAGSLLLVLGHIPLLDLDLPLRLVAVFRIIVAPYLIGSDWRPLFPIPVYFRGRLCVVALRAVTLQRRDAELLSNPARSFKLFESVGVRIPANNVVALGACREVAPLAGLGIYLERSEVFVGPRRVQRDVLMAFKPAIGNQLGK